MPYSKISELPDNVKSLPEHAKEIYMKAFNNAFNQYDGNEGKAHATAWAAVENSYKKENGNWVAKEAVHPHGEHVCVCSKCKEEITVDEGVKCNTQECPKCGAPMVAKEAGERRESMTMESLQSTYSEIIQEAGKRNANADAARLKKIMELCQELLSSEVEPEEKKAKEALKEATSVLKWLKEQAVTRTDDGQSFPSAAYAYVPDSEQASEWKLRLWEDLNKKVTRKQLGAAAAALSPGGFRGQRVEIPKEDLPAVKRKIRAAYRSLDVSDEEMPKWVQESQSRELLAEVISLEEAKLGSKGIAQLVVIQPGFNASKERYYPAETLARDFSIFEGAKMFADHATEAEEKDRPERSIKDWVATLKNVRVDEQGKVIGDAVVIESWMQEKLATLRDKGLLSEMGVSINAVGTAVRSTIEGIKTNFIEKLDRLRSVDFVTWPGAGGMVTLYEADKEHDVDLINLESLKERRPDLVKQIESVAKAEIVQEVKRKMELEEQVKDLEGKVETLTTENEDLKNKMTEADKAKVKAEAQAKIKEAIDKAELPDAAKVRLVESFKDAETDEGVAEAVKSEQDYITELAEAGKVKGMGASKTEPNPEEDHKALVESFKRSGMSDAEAEIAAAGR